MNMQLFPKARTEKLVVKELPDETLIYDLETDEAHCLNQTATWVWKNCDGNHTVGELADELGAKNHTDVSEDVIWLAMDQLEKFNLLVARPVAPFQLGGMTRRELVRRIGIGAIALPLIVSIAAPPASAQASNPSFNLCCTSPADCIAPLTCKQNPTCIGIPAPSTKACIP